MLASSTRTQATTMLATSHRRTPMPRDPMPGGTAAQPECRHLLLRPLYCHCARDLEHPAFVGALQRSAAQPLMPTLRDID